VNVVHTVHRGVLLHEVNVVAPELGDDTVLVSPVSLESVPEGGLRPSPRCWYIPLCMLPGGAPCLGGGTGGPGFAVGALHDLKGRRGGEERSDQ